MLCWDFPGGAVVENPPANAGDTGSGPGLGRSHMPRSYRARAPQLLRHGSRAHALQQEKPTLAASRESQCAATKTNAAKKKWINKLKKNVMLYNYATYYSDLINANISH